MPAKVAKKAAKPAKKVEAPKKAAKPAASKEAPKKVAPPTKAAKTAKLGTPIVPVVEKTPAEKAAKPVKAGKVPKPAAAPVVETAIETPKPPEPKALTKKEKKPKTEPSKSSKPLDEEGEKLLKQWNQMQEQMKSIKPAVYTLQGNFDAKTPIQHKVLGWGYVLKNKGNRIEVLFQDGVKTLVTNYKPS